MYINIYHVIYLAQAVLNKLFIINKWVWKLFEEFE